MTEATERTAKLVLGEIARARQYSTLPAPHELFLSCETLVSALASLIGPKMDAETAYRTDVVTFKAQEGSVAAAEALAKAGKNYADWKKLEMVYELAEHQINLVKKFKDELQAEKYRS